MVTIIALAIMPMASEAAFAGSGSGDGFVPELGREARVFLGTCPGAPCADGKLKLDGNRLEASARGFGFPLDPDQTGRLNHYGLCVESLFIGDDRVESENRRVVLDDGVVNVDGEVRVSGLDNLLGVEVKMYIGEDEPNSGPRDAICDTGPVLLQGIVEFRNLR